MLAVAVAVCCAIERGARRRGAGPAIGAAWLCVGHVFAVRAVEVVVVVVVVVVDMRNFRCQACDLRDLASLRQVISKRLTRGTPHRSASLKRTSKSQCVRHATGTELTTGLSETTVYWW